MKAAGALPKARFSGLPTGDIRSLTGMRGVAALAIVLSHYQITHSVKSYLAVDLFFALSGFVMALVYARSFLTKPGASTYRAFLWKRLARVYPLYLLLTLVTAAFPIPGHPISPVQIGINLLLIQQFGLDVIRSDLGVSIVGQGWSISAELAAYLLFPVIVTLCLHRSRRVAASVVVIAVLVIIGMSLMPFEYDGQYAVLDRHFRWEGVARCLAGFSLGMIAFRAWHDGVLLPTWMGLAIVAGILALSWFDHGDPLIVFCFPFLILCAANPADPLSHVLGSRGPHWLGEISYALYLIHVQPYFYLRDETDRLVAALHLPHQRAASLVLLIGIDLVLAAAALRFVEKPARDYLRKLADRRRPVEPLVAEPAAP